MRVGGDGGDREAVEEAGDGWRRVRSGEEGDGKEGGWVEVRGKRGEEGGEGWLKGEWK